MKSVYFPEKGSENKFPERGAGALCPDAILAENMQAILILIWISQSVRRLLLIATSES